MWNGKPTRRFSFPDYDTYIGKAIRGNLKNDWAATSYGPDGFDKAGPVHTEMNALTMQALQLMNRAVASKAIMNAAALGNAVFDRYHASAICFGGADGLNVDMLIKAHRMLPWPDLWFFLDVPLEESIRRRPERRDRYESDNEHQNHVLTLYKNLFDYMNTPEAVAKYGNTGKWVTINGMMPVDMVHEQVMSVCRSHHEGK